MKSFIDCGHAFILYCYDEIPVPSGVLVRDAREILPESRIFFYKTEPGTGAIGGFANLFRYKLLFEHGGWWVDTDVLCLSSRLPAERIVCGWESETLLGNAVLKFPRNHWLIKKLFLAAEELTRVRADQLEWGETGPQLLTRLVEQFGILDRAFPRHAFYPVQWDESELTRRPEKSDFVKRRVEGSLLFHLWNEMFRRAGVSPQSFPPEGSYLSLMLTKHGVGQTGWAADSSVGHASEGAIAAKLVPFSGTE